MMNAEALSRPHDAVVPLCDALYAGGMWMLDRERPLDAAHFFRAMLLRFATDERGWLGLAACHERIGQDAEAKNLYLTATVAASRKVRSLLALARLVRRTEDNDVADRYLDEAADLAFEEELEPLVALERSTQ